MGSKISLALVAPVDAGKTTLSESLLYNAGSIRKVGRVDTGDTFLDTNVYERERGITIFSKLAGLKIGELDVTLVDTPGHVDFSGEMERALNVTDVSVLLINASDSVQGHTKTLWKLLKARNIPTFIFVNKMDINGTDKDKVLKDIKRELTPEAVDFTDTQSEAFFEDIATGSEALLSEFLENGFIEAKSIKAAVSNRLIFPVFYGAALKNEGVKELMAGLEKYIDNPARKDSFAAVCYKISKDKTGNRETFLKITGGSLKAREIINGEKVNEIRLYSGDKYVVTQEAFAGDICAVTGLKDVKAGMAVGNEKTPPESVLEPVLKYAVKYPDDVDSVTMLNILKNIEEEDPGLMTEYNESVKEISVHLMGEVQTEILARRVEEMANIKISFSTGKVLYKETINDVVEGVGHFEPLRHYAEVHLKLEPLAAGSGLEFASAVSVNDLQLNWQRLILTHLKERIHKGVLTGSPLTDVKITLVAGKDHLKHTEGGDFRQATYRAVRQGLMQAESVLLEPFYNYELIVPDNAVGRAMSDIDRMSGNSNVVYKSDGFTTLTGTAPVATLNGYGATVLAYTRGTGHLSLSLAGYEPCHNAEEVVEKIGYNPQTDVKNTADSVFCSHGVGTVVAWYDVPNYMHLPFTVYENNVSVDEGSSIFCIRNAPVKSEVFVTTEEIDAIIKRTAYSNKKGEAVAYKGMSAALKRRARTVAKPMPKPSQYIGTEAKKRYILVDGYNVVHAWRELADIAERDINGAAGRLIDIASNYAGMLEVDLILVFDAYKVSGHNTEETDFNNIKVVYTKTAETADRYIERYAHQNAKKYDITVITSDGVEQVIIRGEGCHLMSSMDFYEDYERRMQELRDKYNI